MTKEAFIDSVETLYDMRRRVAKNAKYLIEDMLREVGDMSYEYLYGDEDAFVYLDNNYHLYSLAMKGDAAIVYIQSDTDSDYIRANLLKRMHQDDLIEIADYLCRM